MAIFINEYYYGIFMYNTYNSKVVRNISCTLYAVDKQFNKTRLENTFFPGKISEFQFEWRWNCSNIRWLVVPKGGSGYTMLIQSNNRQRLQVLRTENSPGKAKKGRNAPGRENAKPKPILVIVTSLSLLHQLVLDNGVIKHNSITE